MEFSLQIITNGNRANINLEYDGPQDIDREQLKKAIYDIVDNIIDKSIKNDFEESNVLLKDDSVKNLEKPDYIKETEPPQKYNKNDTIDGAVFVQEPDNDGIVVKNDMSYLSYIVVSQIKHNLRIA